MRRFSLPVILALALAAILSPVAFAQGNPFPSSGGSCFQVPGSPDASAASGPSLVGAVLMTLMGTPGLTAQAATWDAALRSVDARPAWLGASARRAVVRRPALERSRR